MEHINAMLPTTLVEGKTAFDTSSTKNTLQVAQPSCPTRWTQTHKLKQILAMG